jgi:hypothetical protein
MSTTAISFFPEQKESSDQNRNQNQLDPTFMNTQIFKEILLEMTYTEQAIKDFTTFCREKRVPASHIIDRFEREYRPESVIFWYTKESFLYSELNRALRTMEGDIIIKMGFFIHDLHYQIEYLHQQQINAGRKKSFTVYRGQCLSKKDFDMLLQTKGGLLSFNNFLSTSEQENVANMFAESTMYDDNLIGILFEISVDSYISLAPFTFIRDLSHFDQEEEILFSRCMPYFEWIQLHRWTATKVNFTV